MQWSLSSREEAERLRNKLEGHESAFEIKVSISAVATGMNVPMETAAVKEDILLPPIISHDTAQIDELNTGSGLPDRLHTRRTSMQGRCRKPDPIATVHCQTAHRLSRPPTTEFQTCSEDTHLR